MEWLKDLIFGGGALHSCFVIALVSYIGITLGKIRVKGIAFGAAFVFFTGIIAGHFGLTLDTMVSEFAKNFGLAIFIFSLGLQVGPSFFPSLKAGGLGLNILSTILLIMNIAITLIIFYATDIPITQMVGVMCGAVSNSAALGAAQQALVDIGGSSSSVADMAMACAASYPFGVISSLLVIVFFHNIFGKRRDGESSLEKIQSKSKPSAITIELTNKEAHCMMVRDVHSIVDKPFIISQIKRGDDIFTPNSATQLKLNDLLLITATSDVLPLIKEGLGHEININWVQNSSLVQRRIFISKHEVNGKSIESLQIRKLFNVNITFVNRAGIELVASPDLVLLVGDRVNLVGDSNSIDEVEKMLGNAITKLDEPNLVVMFMGLMLGILVGSIPIFIPGISIPVKLGLTGGTIIMGILFGAFGYRLKLITYTTQSANLLLRELGITIYLCCLGIDAGEGFINTMINGGGFSLLLYGVIIALLPLLIIGFISLKIMKMDKAVAYGMLCGSVATSQTLPFVNDITGKNIPAVVYSTVYPLNMFLRVITAQLMILFFSNL